ncbi:putative alpha/beta-fold hydrolase [Aeromonas sp. BIGb0405]|uniref:hydrolase n=1 Tax=Aeromonas sp. BIGb0405 TaxID=2940592 RepID=UPI0021683F1D|nr:hydrolase [Aeromonas sp. BIGb0405]MCS3454822.1 putative alpha/beta-fold hydrolase [Aeromonas sp. BIGb0405]
MLTESHFRAPWWARNPHLQTILPKWLRRRPVRYVAERFELPDGDFVDLAWSGPISTDNRPLLVLFHGLEGSVESHYARGMLQHLQQRGEEAVLMHFRGCSGEPNRLLSAYHSGAIEDALALLAELARRFPGKPLLAVGYSLGGNMLVNLLARACPPALKAAAVVSAPMRLDACAHRVNQGFSKVYQRYLLGTMRAHLLSKLAVHPQAAAHFRAGDIKGIRTLYQFDQQVTAPLHGFESADHYYQCCSGLPLLSQIAVPTLILHAADDPFMTHEVIPQAEHLSPSVQYELSQQGGHVGFVYGSPWRPRFWLEERISQWLGEQGYGATE